MKKLVLYSYYRSSASYRVRIALNLKGLDYEYRAVHLLKNGGEQRSSEYLKLNPMGHVPTLVDDDFVLSESMAIFDYLEHLKPSPPLYPSDPRQRAQVIRFCELINSGIQPLQNVKINKFLQERVPAQPGLKDEWNRHWITSGLQTVEKILEQNSGTYCFGGVVTAADCVLVPQAVSSKRFGVDTEQFPNITRIVAACDKLEAFQKAHPSKQPDAE